MPITEDDLQLIARFSREILEPLHQLKKEINGVNAARLHHEEDDDDDERVYTPDHEDVELSETGSVTATSEVIEAFEDPSDSAYANSLEAKKAAILDKFREAEAFAKKHAHLSLLFSESLEHLTTHGKGLIRPSNRFSDTTYKTSINERLKAIGALGKEQAPLLSAPVRSDPRNNPMNQFLNRQETFIYKLEELRLHIRAFQWPGNELNEKERADQEIIDDYLDTLEKTIASHKNLGFTQILKEADSNKKEEDFVTACDSEAFQNYSELQQRLSLLQNRIKHIPLPEKVYECAKEPQKNIRNIPYLLEKVAKKHTDIQGVIEPIRVKAKAVYLQTRTIKHFQQWPLHSDDPKKMDKKTAVLRSLLLLNLNSETYALQFDRKTPKDEVTDIDTYLTTVLIEAFPETFTLDENGRLFALAKDKDTQQRITEALGLDLVPPIDPKKFDLDALNALESEDVNNPLWAVLKTMKPVVATEFDLDEKIAAYATVTKLIASNKLGHHKQANIGLNVVNTAIQIMRQNKHRVSTNDTEQGEAESRIKNSFNGMQAHITQWEEEKHKEDIKKSKEKHQKKYGRFTRKGIILPKKSETLSVRCTHLANEGFIGAAPTEDPEAVDLSYLKDLVAEAPTRATITIAASRSRPDPILEPETKERKLDDERKVHEELLKEVIEHALRISQKSILSNEDKKEILDILWKTKEIAKAHPEMRYTISELFKKNGVLGARLQETTNIFQDGFYKKQLAADFRALSGLEEETLYDYLYSSIKPWVEAQSDTGKREAFNLDISAALIKEERFVSKASEISLLSPILLASKHLKKSDIKTLEQYSEMTDALVQAYENTQLRALFKNEALTQEQMTAALTNIYQSPAFETYMKCIENLALKQQEIEHIIAKCGMSDEQSEIFNTFLMQAPERLGAISTDLKAMKVLYAELHGQATADATFNPTLKHLAQRKIRFNAQKEARLMIQEGEQGLTKPQHILRSTLILALKSCAALETSALETNNQMDGYLKTILLELHSEKFEQTASGQLKIIEPNADKAALIYEALGGDRVTGAGHELILNDLITPNQLNANKLNELSQTDSTNPLWRTLKVIQHTATPLTLQSKLLAYQESIDLIASGQLGAKDRFNICLIHAQNAMREVERELRRCALAEPVEDLENREGIVIIAISIFDKIKALESASLSERVEATRGRETFKTKHKSDVIGYCEGILEQINAPLANKASAATRQRDERVEKDNLEEAAAAILAKRASREKLQTNVPSVLMPYLKNDSADKAAFFAYFKDADLPKIKEALGITEENKAWNPYLFMANKLEELIQANHGNLKQYWIILKTIPQANCINTSAKIPLYQELFKAISPITDDNFALVTGLSEDILETAMIEKKLEPTLISDYIKSLESLKDAENNPVFSAEQILMLYQEMIDKVAEMKNLTITRELSEEDISRGIKKAPTYSPVTEEMLYPVVTDLIQNAIQLTQALPAIIQSREEQQHRAATAASTARSLATSAWYRFGGVFHAARTAALGSDALNTTPMLAAMNDIIKNNFSLESKIKIYQDTINTVLQDTNLSEEHRANLAMDLLKQAEQLMIKQAKTALQSEQTEIPKTLDIIFKIEQSILDAQLIDLNTNEDKKFDDIRAIYRGQLVQVYQGLIHLTAESGLTESVTFEKINKLMIDAMKAIAVYELYDDGEAFNTPEKNYPTYQEELTDFLTDLENNVIPNNLSLKNKVKVYESIILFILDENGSKLDDEDAHNLALELFKKAGTLAANGTRNPEILQIIQDLEVKINPVQMSEDHGAQFIAIKAQHQAALERPISEPSGNKTRDDDDDDDDEHFTPEF